MVANPQRSAALRQLSKHDFYQAKMKNGSHLILIENHKTSNKYGAMEVVMNQSLYKDVCKFLDFFNIETTFVFTTYSGEQMSYMD